MLSDFMRREAVVDIGGRRFVCGRPTLRTVLVALDVFADAIGGMLMVERDPGIPQPDQCALAVAFAKAFPERAAVVLDTCVRGGPIPGEHVEPLVRAVVGLTDLGRIVDSLALDKFASGGGGGDAPPLLEREIVVLAARFGTTPESVMDWPYEQVLGVRDVDEYAVQTEESPHTSEFMRLAHEAARSAEKARG